MRRSSMLEICINQLFKSIRQSFSLKQDRIGNGCSGDSFETYQNILLTTIAKSRSGRLNSDQFIAGLESVFHDCESYQMMSTGELSFDGTVNVPLVNEYNSGLTDLRFRQVPEVEPNRFQDFINTVKEKIAELKNFLPLQGKPSVRMKIAFPKIRSTDQNSK
jgi:hypothetical protein